MLIQIPITKQTGSQRSGWGGPKWAWIILSRTLFVGMISVELMAPGVMTPGVMAQTPVHPSHTKGTNIETDPKSVDQNCRPIAQAFETVTGQLVTNGGRIEAIGLAGIQGLIHRQTLMIELYQKADCMPATLVNALRSQSIGLTQLYRNLTQLKQESIDSPRTKRASITSPQSQNQAAVQPPPTPPQPKPQDFAYAAQNADTAPVTYSGSEPILQKSRLNQLAREIKNLSAPKAKKNPSTQIRTARKTQTSEQVDPLRLPDTTMRRLINRETGGTKVAKPPSKPPPAVYKPGPLLPPPMLLQLAESVNLHTQPGTQYRILRTLKKNDQIIIIRSTPQGKWLEVETKDKQRGFLTAQALVWPLSASNPPSANRNAASKGPKTTEYLARTAEPPSSVAPPPQPPPAVFTPGGIPPSSYKIDLDSWYQAAQKGHAVAQYNLGIALLNGIGTAPNPSLGYAYLKQAARAGYPLAQQVLARISRK